MISPSHSSRAEETLLATANIGVTDVRDRLAAVMNGLDWADVYLQKRVQENWQLEENEVKTGHYAVDGGIGLRAVRGATTVCASSDIVSASALDFLSDVAAAAKTHGGEYAATTIPATTAPPRFGADNPLLKTADAEKIALLKKINAILRAESDVENVIASLSASHETVLIIRPDGLLAADYRPMTRLNIRVIVVEDGKRESGGAGGGGRDGYAMFSETMITSLCAQALQDARGKLRATAAPAGKMPVVLGPGWAGVLLHEAVGHGLEGDFNRKRLSAFTGKIGEQVAARGVTVVDAGNIDGRRGSLSCDDEGTPTRETVLIEDGVLRGYMQDLTNARLMKTAATGNGRRESYAHQPMPRMTNTFMLGGKYAPAEIIASVSRGIYAEDFNGGEVDITNGNFVFVAAKARLIENGKLGATVKGATIIGNGPAVMPQVSMVGDDFSLDPGVGSCGKNGQWVPVGVGQPTIKIDSITVGGTETG